MFCGWNPMEKFEESVQFPFFFFFCACASLSLLAGSSIRVHVRRQKNTAYSTARNLVYAYFDNYEHNLPNDHCQTRHWICSVLAPLH
jgi:hypothetical protein